MPLLSVSDLGKSYDATPVLEHTSFEVEAGESMAFVSPSGSGKSTLLSMVGLLLEPTTGMISFADGTRASELDDTALSRLRQRMFGFVFQHTQLVGSLRAIENVLAPANFARDLDFDPEERAHELLGRFGLEDREQHFPYQLSIGQKRRVAVARALLLKPQVIIADEPTNDLDAQSARNVADALFEYAAQGHALLYATHDLDLAARADHLMRLEGRAFVDVPQSERA